MPSWMWFVLSFSLLALEVTFAAGFFLLFFAVGAAVVGFGALVHIPNEQWQQWLAFAAVSVFSLVLFRSKLQSRVQVRHAITDRDSLVGATAHTRETISPGAMGYVELRGTQWRARNVSPVPIERGRDIRVISRDGLTLDVVPLEIISEEETTDGRARDDDR